MSRVPATLARVPSGPRTLNGRRKGKFKNGKGATLNPRQSAFIRHYMRNGFNACAAARSAGYSKPTAKAHGFRLLGIGIVKEEIARCLDGEGITRERIKIEIAQIAFGADLADVEPYLNGEKSLVELREEGFDTRLVKSASVTPNLHGTARKVELHDRLAALEKLARIRKLVDGDSAPPIVATVRIDVLTTLTAMLNRMEAAIPEGSDCLTVPLLEGEVLSARVIEVEEPDDD